MMDQDGIFKDANAARSYLQELGKSCGLFDKYARDFDLSRCLDRNTGQRLWETQMKIDEQLNQAQALLGDLQNKWSHLDPGLQQTAARHLSQLGKNFQDIHAKHLRDRRHIQDRANRNHRREIKSRTSDYKEIRALSLIEEEDPGLEPSRHPGFQEERQQSTGKQREAILGGVEYEMEELTHGFQQLTGREKHGPQTVEDPQAAREDVESLRVHYGTGHREDEHAARIRLYAFLIVSAAFVVTILLIILIVAFLVLVFLKNKG